MSTTVLEWKNLTTRQQQRVREKVLEDAETVNSKHKYLNRLKRSRMRSSAAYVLIPKSSLRPSEFQWVVWKRLGKKAVVCRRALLHEVYWELLGPRTVGVRKRVKLPFDVKVVNSQDREVWEDFAASMSLGHKMRK